MAASKHPLDLFRSSKSGFDSATRDTKQRRRTMAGKVLVSTPRQAEEGSDAVTAVEAATMDEEDVVDAIDEAVEEEESPANALEAILAQRRALDAQPEAAATDDVAGDEAPEEAAEPSAAAEEISSDDEPDDAPRRRVKVPSQPLRPVGLNPAPNASSTPAVTRPLTQTAQSDTGLALPPGISSSTRTLSYLLLAAAGTLALGLWIFSFFTDGDEGGGVEDGTLPLQNAASANSGTDVALGSAATPSEFTIQAGHYGTKIDAAYDALDALEARGFTEVNITGVDDGNGGFAEINLIVGRADSKRALEGTLAKLRSTSLPNDNLPFYEAYIVGHPESE